MNPITERDAQILTVQQVDDLTFKIFMGTEYGVPATIRWNPTYDMNTAFDLIHSIRNKDPLWCPSVYFDDADGLEAPCWICHFDYYGENASAYKEVTCYAERPELAICRAALVVATRGWL